MGKVLLFVCVFFCLSVCLFVRLRISPPRIKLAASNFARRLIGAQGRESHILGNFAFQKPKIGRTGQREPRTPLQYIARSRIGMCGYRSVATDVGLLVVFLS